MMELSDAMRDLYEGYLRPVLEYADKPLVTGFVTSVDDIGSDALVPGKDQPDELAFLNHGQYPSYSWPGGLLILYDAACALPATDASYTDETEYVCAYCAMDIHDGEAYPLKKLVAWKVHTSGLSFQCPLCRSYKDGQLESIL